MSYYDWQHLTKPFRFSPVVQDTTRNLKPLSITPVDDVHTGVYYFRIPATFVPIITTIDQSIILAQYNYTVPTDISVLNFNDKTIDASYSGPTVYIHGCAICLRFRVGNVVTRYLIKKSLGTTFNGKTKLFFKEYTGQRIRKNFVVELWQTRYGFPDISYISQDILINTGIIFFPSNENDTGNIINPVESCTLAQLETPLPENVPTAVDAAGPWLTN